MVSRRNPQGIPAPIGVQDPAVVRIIEAIRENLAGQQTVTQRVNALDRVIGSVDAAIQDLIEGYRPGPVEHLDATGVFGAVLLEASGLPAQAAYLEWLASDTDDPGTAIVVGASDVPLFRHYTGDTQGRYYWVRAVGAGTPGKTGPINATSGTYAKPANDPDAPLSALTKQIWTAGTAYSVFDTVLPSDAAPVDMGGVAAAFRAESAGVSGTAEPSWSSATTLGDTVHDNGITWRAVDSGQAPLLIIGNQVFIDDALIRQAAITSAQIKDLAANKISAAELSAITANLGDVTAGTFRTTPSSALRTEISSQGAFPIWVGSGNKTAANALLWLDSNDLHVRGDVIASGIQANAANIVSTLMLQDQAVTFPMGFSADANIGLNNSFTQVAQFVVPPNTFIETTDCMVFFGFAYRLEGQSTNNTANDRILGAVRLYQDSQEIHRVTFAEGRSEREVNIQGPDWFAIVTRAGVFGFSKNLQIGPAGSTITMSIATGEGGMSWNSRRASDRYITVVGLKR